MEQIKDYVLVTEAEIQADLVEEFRPVVGYENYYLVSSHGNVKSIRMGLHRVMKQANTKGYKAINLKVKGKAIMKKVHRLVAEAFIPNPNDYPLINHLDSDKTNNKVSNLEWSTSKLNTAHGIKFGNIKISGEDSPNTDLTNDDVMEIRRLFSESCISINELGIKYNKKIGTIQNIVNNKSWLHLPLGKTAKERNWEKYKSVRKDLAEGFSHKNLMLKYKISRATFDRIRYYTTYLDKKGWV